MSKKFEKNLIVAVPENLFVDFKKKCDKRYTTMSQEIRNFMLQYIEDNNNVKNKKHETTT